MKKNSFKLGLSLGFRNISDAITTGIERFEEEDFVIFHTRFFNNTNLGIAPNITYQRFFKKGFGLSAEAGYNHYFTQLNKKSNNQFYSGGSDFLKIGLGLIYKF